MIEEKILTIDLGTTEIRAALGVADRKGNKKIIAMASAPSRGIKSGNISSVVSVKDALNEALNKLKIESATHLPNEAYVIISGTHTLSYKVEAQINFPGIQTIQFKDVNDLKNKAEKELLDKKGPPVKQHYETMHIIPQEFIIENLTGIQNPVGHSGRELAMKALIVLVTKHTKRTIEELLKDCGLKLNGLILQSLAAFYGTKGKEKTYFNNNLFIYMGAGTTEYFYFREDKPVFNKYIPDGGNDIIEFILSKLKLNRKEIEKLFLEHGSAYAFKVPQNEYITISLGGKLAKLPKIVIPALVQIRLKKILKDIKTELENTDPSMVVNLNKIYLAGGLTKLKDIDILTKKIFKAPVEICHPDYNVLDLSLTPVIGGINYIAATRKPEGKLFEVKDDIIPKRHEAGFFGWFKRLIDQLI
ncbi:cell division protein FtsA [Desulfurobacterium indicum]|uniref:Cell division protein FtsA n=1 Tax=Desulfurobacterium indicum TaxID=1914305 RepID=A0A1R1MMW0_9BACT|nr:cell division FtsA domain-containing protein [Desulfurobacterium indicum]OMH41107.1 cell division protein FtsA [Desulfurobacterium indicum]